jgi:NAD(P)H-dependent FMN reductase
MESLLVPVIYGSVRRERVGIRAARFAVAELEKRGHRPLLIDPVERPLPLLGLMYKEYPKGEAPASLEDLAQTFRSADAFVVVSGEYNHGVPPALANLMDYFLEEYFWRPCGIVTYSGGRFGGVRAGYALRSMLGEMGMVTIPTIFPIANVADAFDERGTPSDPKTSTYVATFFDELCWYARALKEARKGGVPY